MERYLCIHGHFYQPPRENPWLEAVELQDSAFPYHDWNDRITVECYEPNAASRILDEEGRIVRIVDNYERISFNFGPTLLSWMEEKAPETYRAIQEADADSRDRCGGHGNALAQGYNHMILPLASPRDIDTQVVWGIRDFEYRFGRRPEGMWLPETAADLASLEALARHGIRFTILSPGQAARVRRIGKREWTDVSGGRIDPTMPYVQRLPSGEKIDLFFYDGPISRAVAFEGLLRNGEAFAHRLMSGFSDTRNRPQLVHIATDGESYGHHHRFGEMALSYALRYIARNGLARITNYGEFLEMFPPTHEVEIFENSSWSCAHGVERWRSDCGCRIGGGGPGWDQAWRGPLRKALDGLRDEATPLFEELAGKLLRDPWEARNAYVGVILDRCPRNVDRFLSRHALHPPTPSARTTILRLMELQRHAMLMYTSCGWFFDEISGLEATQVLLYAGRVVNLAQTLFEVDLLPGLLGRLEKAKSNIPGQGDGRRIYERAVAPSVVDLKKVGAHYAVSSMFEPYGERTRVFCYTVDRRNARTFPVGAARFALGRARVASTITENAREITYGVLHLGDHNFSGGVRAFHGEEAYRKLSDEIEEAYRTGELPELMRVVDRNFGGNVYSLKSLFKDEQRKILKIILDQTLDGAESVYRQAYERHAPLLRFLRNQGIVAPKGLSIGAEFVLNRSLQRAFEAPFLDRGRIDALLSEAQQAGISLDEEGLGYSLKQALRGLAKAFRAAPTEVRRIRELSGAVDLVRAMPFRVPVWRTQNIYYHAMQSVLPRMRDMAAEGDAGAQEWVERFLALGAGLGVRTS